MNNPSQKNGMFLGIIQRGRVELFYLPSKSLRTFSLEVVRERLEFSSFSDLSETVISSLLGPGVKTAYSGEALEKTEDLVVQLQFLMAGFSTRLDDQTTELGSTDYLILDPEYHFAYISLFQKAENLNTTQVNQLLMKLNNFFEVAHYANSHSISPLCEDFALSMDYDHMEQQQCIMSFCANDEKPIKRESWLLLKRYSSEKLTAYVCYECNSVSKEKCSCWENDPMLKVLRFAKN